MTKRKYKQKCQFCGREWEGRLEHPKQCIFCKRYLNPPPRKIYQYKKRKK